MDEDIIIVVFKAKRSNVEEVVGFLSVLVIQSVVSRAAEEKKIAKICSCLAVQGVYLGYHCVSYFYQTQMLEELFIKLPFHIKRYPFIAKTRGKITIAITFSRNVRFTIANLVLLLVPALVILAQTFYLRVLDDKMVGSGIEA